MASPAGMLTFAIMTLHVAVQVAAASKARAACFAHEWSLSIMCCAHVLDEKVLMAIASVALFALERAAVVMHGAHVLLHVRVCFEACAATRAYKFFWGVLFDGVVGVQTGACVIVICGELWLLLLLLLLDCGRENGRPEHVLMGMRSGGVDGSGGGEIAGAVVIGNVSVHGIRNGGLDIPCGLVLGRWLYVRGAVDGD